jgi:hypothetical protein
VGEEVTEDQTPEAKRIAVPTMVRGIARFIPIISEIGPAVVEDRSGPGFPSG